MKTVTRTAFRLPVVKSEIIRGLLSLSGIQSFLQSFHLFDSSFRTKTSLNISLSARYLISEVDIISLPSDKCSTVFRLRQKERLSYTRISSYKLIRWSKFIGTPLNPLFRLKCTQSISAGVNFPARAATFFAPSKAVAIVCADYSKLKHRKTRLSYSERPLISRARSILYVIVDSLVLSLRVARSLSIPLM